MDRRLRKSREQENRGAERYGGRRTPGSGNGVVKNDVRSPDLSIEYKYTDAASYSLKLSDLLLAERNALLDGRTALFGISFAGHNYVVLTEDDFSTYRDYYQGAS